MYNVPHKHTVLYTYIMCPYMRSKKRDVCILMLASSWYLDLIGITGSEHIHTGLSLFALLLLFSYFLLFFFFFFFSWCSLGAIIPLDNNRQNLFLLYIRYFDIYFLTCTRERTSWSLDSLWRIRISLASCNSTHFPHDVSLLRKISISLYRRASHLHISKKHAAWPKKFFSASIGGKINLWTKVYVLVA